MLTAGLARWRVRGLSRVPAPPPKMMEVTFFMSTLVLSFSRMFCPVFTYNHVQILANNYEETNSKHYPSTVTFPNNRNTVCNNARSRHPGHNFNIRNNSVVPQVLLGSQSNQIKAKRARLPRSLDLPMSGSTVMRS